MISRSAVRVGDRHDAWTFTASDAMRTLTGAAYATGIDFELAVRLVVESALICDDLDPLGIDVLQLDVAAATERVERQLDAAASAYVRRLTRGCNAPRRELSEAVTVGLPVRLNARLLQADIEALLERGDIARAIRWETAAVLTGRTMSEWAPLMALRTFAAPRRSEIS